MLVGLPLTIAEGGSPKDHSKGQSAAKESHHQGKGKGHKANHAKGHNGKHAQAKKHGKKRHDAQLHVVKQHRVARLHAWHKSWPHGWHGYFWWHDHFCWHGHSLWHRNYWWTTVVRRIVVGTTVIRPTIVAPTVVGPTVIGPTIVGPTVVGQSVKRPRAARKKQRIPDGWVQIINRKAGLVTWIWGKQNGLNRIEPVGDCFKIRCQDSGEYLCLKSGRQGVKKLHEGTPEHYT